MGNLLDSVTGWPGRRHCSPRQRYAGSARAAGGSNRAGRALGARSRRGHSRTRQPRGGKGSSPAPHRTRPQVDCSDHGPVGGLDERRAPSGYAASSTSPATPSTHRTSSTGSTATTPANRYSTRHAGSRSPTAIIAGNDIIAIGVLDAARRAGIRVPEELSIIGFDDIPMSSWHSFRLTTVHQDIQGMAIQAARCLIESIQNPDHRPAHYRYPASLTVRGTTAPPRGKLRGEDG